MSGRLLSSTFKFVSGHTEVADSLSHDLEDVLVTDEYYPASGSYIDVSGAERVHVLIHVGTLADPITFQLYEAETADGTEDALSATYYKHTCAAADDGEFIVITIEVSRMSLDHHFLTTKVGAVSGSDYAAIVYLLEMYGELPPTQGDYFPDGNQYYFTG